MGNPFFVKISERGKTIHSYRMDRVSRHPKNYKEFYTTRLD